MQRRDPSSVHDQIRTWLAHRIPADRLKALEKNAYKRSKGLRKYAEMKWKVK